MSHPNPSHERENEYPEDNVSHYPKKERLGDKLIKKGKALRKTIATPSSPFEKALKIKK